MKENVLCLAKDHDYFHCKIHLKSLPKSKIFHPIFAIFIPQMSNIPHEQCQKPLSFAGAWGYSFFCGNFINPIDYDI